MISECVRHVLVCCIISVVSVCVWSSHSLLKVSPPEDEDLHFLIDKMATFVAEGGAELEKKAMEDYKDNPVFSYVSRRVFECSCNNTSMSF